MNSSAKVFFSISAIGALGAVAFACTVGSGTVDDVDGGTNTSSSSSSSGSTATDAGDAGAAKCVDNTNVKFEPTCEACIQEKCQCEFTGCFNTLDEPDGGKTGCEGYAFCVQECEGATPSDQAAVKNCIKEYCDFGAFPEVPESFDKFAACRNSKCNTECPSN